MSRGSSISFHPNLPRSYRPGIGLIGCGGITEHHLHAYRAADFQVVALCDLRREAAENRRAEYFPNASVYTDYRELLMREDVSVVDIATHPTVRAAMIRDAIEAGKHVLSQKPFVLDLHVGQELCDLAERHQCVLAVNQNARWAPHYCYLRNAVDVGLIGSTFALHQSVHWDHSWVEGTMFETIKHLILYDYAIHWFDLQRSLLPECRPIRVYASTARGPDQQVMPDLLGQCMIEWSRGQSTLTFDGSVRFAQQERTYLAGTLGTLESTGPIYRDQHVTLTTESEVYQPELVGQWFPDAFAGTMGELLCSIEEGRPCSIAARDNLESLALCFAAIASSECHRPIRPWEVTKLPEY